MLRAGLVHAAHDALGDDVAGGELGELVLADHEADAVRVDEVRALAADRLGDQRLLALRVRAEPQHRRVELHELQVRDLRAGTQRERHAVAGGDGRVGGGGEDLAEAAGGEDDGPRVDRADAVALALAHDVQGQTRRAALRVRQQVQHQGVLDQFEVVVGADGLDQGARYLRAGRVPARVGDTTAVVAALAGEQDLALVVLVEGRSGGDQAADRARALGDEHPHRLLVAQARARDEGVLQVLLGGVALAERGGDAALCPAGRAVVEHRLGDDQHAQARLTHPQGRGEPGDAGADDDDVGRLRPARRGGGESAR